MSGWALVFRGDPIQANVAAAVLESSGIPVQVFADSAYGPLVDARLFVPTERAGEAEALLEAGLNSFPPGQ